MSLTRAQFESELVSRRSGMMQIVSMAVTTTGANASLNGPIGFAVRQAGGSVANVTSVADSDIATVSDDSIDQMFDMAEYRLLLNIKGMWGKVDISSGPFSQSLSQFADQLDNDIKAMKEAITAQYGYGGYSFEAGVIDLGSMQTDPDAL